MIMFTKKRPDGTYIQKLHFFTRIMPYLMPTRTEATIYFEQEFDVTETLKYIRQKRRAENAPKISMFYMILFAAVRVIAQRPKLNRFISGYRFYQRNRIRFNFVAKKDLSDEGEEINVTMSFSPFLTLEQFCEKIHHYVLSLKSGSGTGTEKLNVVLSSLPRFLIKAFFNFVKFLDHNNALPLSVIDDLPFYNTIFFTNVGSVGIDAPFHHNFEIGNCGIFCAIGKVRKERQLGPDGTVETRDTVKITFTYDDRITDGIYCARAIDMLKDYVENPEKLEIPLELTNEQLEKLGLAEKELLAEESTSKSL
jgi:hypothetical protein